MKYAVVYLEVPDLVELTSCTMRMKEGKECVVIHPTRLVKGR